MTIQEKAHKIAELTDSTDVVSRFKKWNEEVNEAKYEFAIDDGTVVCNRENAIAELRDVIITTLSLAQALGCPDLLAVAHVKADEVIARLQK